MLNYHAYEILLDPTFSHGVFHSYLKLSFSQILSLLSHVTIAQIHGSSPGIRPLGFWQ